MHFSIIRCSTFCPQRKLSHIQSMLFLRQYPGSQQPDASILTDVEVLPHCILLWRSFTHWIGGMGVLVFLLSLLPLAGGYHMNLMKAESPGPSVSKLVPKVQSDRQNSLHDLYWNDTVPDYSSSDRQNSSVRYPVYCFWYRRYWWIWYRQ